MAPDISDKINGASAIYAASRASLQLVAKTPRSPASSVATDVSNRAPKKEPTKGQSDSEKAYHHHAKHKRSFVARAGRKRSRYVKRGAKLPVVIRPTPVKHTRTQVLSLKNTLKQIPSIFGSIGKVPSPSPSTQLNSPPQLNSPTHLAKLELTKGVQHYHQSPSPPPPPSASQPHQHHHQHQNQNQHQHQQQQQQQLRPPSVSEVTHKSRKSPLPRLALNFIKTVKKSAKQKQENTSSKNQKQHAQKKTPEVQPVMKATKSETNSSVFSTFHVRRLKRDGRKTPDHYRKVALTVTSPSQLSVKSITEHYILQPDSQFTNADDVFQYRGYKKLNKIDEGAFGVVSKAVRMADNLVVAVKEVDLRRKKAKRIEEMKRELFMLQQIDSENVVKLIEHFIIGQMLVIIMEFCAGSNLTTYLKEVAIDEAEARFLFRQMAASIKVLHKKGFAHRDVKLNNFLLDSTRKHVKIGDFGLSVVSFKKSQGILMAKTYCGTEPYMAPEILKRNSYGVRSYNPIYSDIWSLGVCLFAMLTRTFPFKMQTSQDGLFKAQIARRWRFPRTLREILSEEIKDLVWHMLDPEPERRITINNVLAHPWLNQNELVVMSAEEDNPA